MRSVQKVTKDSSLSWYEAVLQNPALSTPESSLRLLEVVLARYWSFDNHMHEGQIVVRKDVVGDITTAFNAMEREHFPLASVVPVADPRFHWDDNLSMEANNTSAFNYRKVVGDESRMSYHAYGLAIDINPLLNPYHKGDVVLPSGARYDVAQPGTIAADGFLVALFKKLGWKWGGDFETLKDYQHFEKHGGIDLP